MRLVVTIVMLFILVPVAVIVTLLAVPVWSWIEKYFSIEAIGHSGPAQWCYLVVYLLTVLVWLVVWGLGGRRSK